MRAGLLAAYNQPLTQSSRYHIPAANTPQLCPAPSGSKISNYPVLRAALISCARSLVNFPVPAVTGDWPAGCSSVSHWLRLGPVAALMKRPMWDGIAEQHPFGPCGSPLWAIQFLGQIDRPVRAFNYYWLALETVKVRHARRNRPMVLQAVL